MAPTPETKDAGRLSLTGNGKDKVEIWRNFDEEGDKVLMSSGKDDKKKENSDVVEPEDVPMDLTTSPQKTEMPPPPPPEAYLSPDRIVKISVYTDVTEINALNHLKSMPIMARKTFRNFFQLYCPILVGKYKFDGLTITSHKGKRSATINDSILNYMNQFKGIGRLGSIKINVDLKPGLTRLEELTKGKEEEKENPSPPPPPPKIPLRKTIMNGLQQIPLLAAARFPMRIAKLQPAPVINGPRLLNMMKFRKVHPAPQATWTSRPEHFEGLAHPNHFQKNYTDYSKFMAYPGNPPESPTNVPKKPLVSSLTIMDLDTNCIVTKINEILPLDWHPEATLEKLLEAETTFRCGPVQNVDICEPDEAPETEDLLEPLIPIVSIEEPEGVFVPHGMAEMTNLDRGNKIKKVGGYSKIKDDENEEYFF